MGVMNGYKRPEIEFREYRDEGGNVIPFGERWGFGEPTPESAYETVTYGERYAPLHEIADALVTYLTAEYDVEVVWDGELPETDLWDQAYILRSANLIPAAPDAAPLLVGFTNFPGIRIHAGERAEFNFPSCGCDACDESVQALIE